MPSGERIIEMTWRCTSCGGKNLGRFKNCQTCNNPKDGSEEYEMPADPSKAVSVTEESLLRMASAGPDWRCAYCGSDQRRSDMGCQSCGASAVEGAEVPDAPAPAARPLPMRAAAAASQGKAGVGTLLVKIGAGLAFSCVALGALFFFIGWNLDRPRDFTGTVSDVHWERSVTVERWQLKPGEAFKDALPADALAVKSVGQKVHHHEDVLDHYDSERYSVEVPDGTRTETYSERVSCGEDCTDKPESCSEKCTSNKNGFATCKTVCTGGGKSCRTRYCNETRTRQVPKTRTEWRTRQVPRYRSEPRYAEAFSYQQWQWAPERTAQLSGGDVNLRWPKPEAPRPLGDGEKEREQKQEKYSVTVSYAEDKAVSFAPEDETAFSAFAPGSKHKVHTENGRVDVDGKTVQAGR